MSATRERRLSRLAASAACCATALAAAGVLAPAALASAPGATVPAGFLGLPSLHGIIEAIANGFFSALAKALVPSWLTHGTVATIQHLVALPNPAEWSHVRSLQGETTYLGAMLAPLTLTVAALRYWTLGLTGAAHPASAVARCAGATGVLVAYRWIVEQVVAGTNTLTHGLLGLPSVSAGLGRIIGVLFGGALLSGSGGVFGALLVIVGVIFAAGLFATQVLLTVVLAVLIVAGPPLIALAAIPELSHLARAWRDALMTVALIPLGWTVLFATAGALCLDATSLTGGAAGLPGHVAAAFAGLITFALAVKLPLVLLGELRHVLSRASLSAGGTASPLASMPGAERVRSAHARLRAIGLAGAPALGASLGAAAGALGAPAGGPLGAARRRLSLAANRSAPESASDGAAPTAGRGRGIGERVLAARAILASAPREASRAVRSATRTNAGAAPREKLGGQAAPRAASRRPERPERSGVTGREPRAAATPPQDRGAHSASASRSRPKARVTLTPVRGPSVAQPAERGEGRPSARSSPPRAPQIHAVEDGERTGAAGAERARSARPGPSRSAGSAAHSAPSNPEPARPRPGEPPTPGPSRPAPRKSRRRAAPRTGRKQGRP